MRQYLTRLALASAVLALAASAASAQQPAQANHALDRANLDTTCAACQNFFQFANGGWLKKATIPAAYSSWGSFNELNDKNTAVVHSILDEAAASVATSPKGSNRWKIGTFYAACMDTAAIEKLGAEPLKPILSTISTIRTSTDLSHQIGALEARAGLAPFGFFAGPDPKNSTVVIAQAGQGGLGLPDRDYYLNTTNPRFAALREAYVGHIEKMLTLAGEAPAEAKADAQAVMGFETELARLSMSRVQMRDPNAIYHKMTLGEFQRTTPHLDWVRFLQQQGARGITVVNVFQPDYFRAVDSLVANAPIDTWKAYLRWHAVKSKAPALSSAFVNEDFRFNSMLTGAKEQLPRWRKCANVTGGVLGEAVGQEYVKRTFTPEAKARALAMVDNMISVLRDDIHQLDWMSDSTKTRAIAKLDAFTRKIGYPDRWKDYSKLEVRPDAYAEDLRLASEFERARNWAKVGKPVDRSEWGMTPQTVNAYYNPQYNEIVFPAGILQPPFFDANADDAVNYGAMGAVIGHEMSHGFDDQGRQYDKDGNLKDWWTADDAAKYKERAQKVVDQFDAYTVVDSTTHVNGKLTLGENIGDLGGLKIAYLAFKKAQSQKGVTLASKDAEKIDGFTPDQRFFLAWAQVWRQAMRPEAERTQVMVDPHAPAIWRVNGPLSNMPEFKAAWGCKDGDAMVRPEDKRAQIW